MKKIFLVFVISIVLLLSTPINAEETKLMATITAYTLKECKGNNGKTASGKTVREGMVAVSPDLERLGLTFGTIVNISGFGSFVVYDRTSSKLKRTIDIYMKNHRKALKFGKKHRAIKFNRER
jgi:3D (Asp-Asp-Asp) domain-containing protein